MRGVPRPTAGWVVLVVAEVDRQLLTQRPLEDRPGDLRQQPVRAEELHPLRLGAGQQLVGQPVIDQRPPAAPVPDQAAPAWFQCQTSRAPSPDRAAVQSRATSLIQTI